MQLCVSILVIKLSYNIRNKDKDLERAEELRKASEDAAQKKQEEEQLEKILGEEEGGIGGMGGGEMVGGRGGFGGRVAGGEGGGEEEDGWGDLLLSRGRGRQAVGPRSRQRIEQSRHAPSF